jgi:hypothetical protein
MALEHKYFSVTIKILFKSKSYKRIKMYKVSNEVLLLVKAIEISSGQLCSKSSRTYLTNHSFFNPNVHLLCLFQANSLIAHQNQGGHRQLLLGNSVFQKNHESIFSARNFQTSSLALTESKETEKPVEKAPVATRYYC